MGNFEASGREREIEVYAVDDSATTLKIFSAWMRRAGLKHKVFERPHDLLLELQTNEPDVICLDVELPGVDGIGMLRAIRREHPGIQVVMFTAQDTARLALQSVRLGAFDYIVKPGTEREVVDCILHAAALSNRLNGITDLPLIPGVLGTSEAMKQLSVQVGRVAQTKISVALHGESGTGKELVAKAIHELGSGPAAPFVAINCGAIAESLQESELFGHEKGAFTGASSVRKGKFEQANGGTIFLDEVAELTPSAQIRMLRVLQEKNLERVGGTTSIDLDVRVICATHKNLELLVQNGLFREDLYYRLVVFPIELPPLRDRIEDIDILAQHFVRKYGPEVGVEYAEIHPVALDQLRSLRWPGNVRELENAIYSAIVRSQGGTICLEHLPVRLNEKAVGTIVGPLSFSDETGLNTPINGSVRPITTKSAVVRIDDLERQAIEDALSQCQGNISSAAKQLGIGRATLYRKMERFGLRKAS